MISVSPAQLSPPHAFAAPRLLAARAPDTAGGFAPCPSMWGSSHAAHLHEPRVALCREIWGKVPYRAVMPRPQPSKHDACSPMGQLISLTPQPQPQHRQSQHSGQGRPQGIAVSAFGIADAIFAFGYCSVTRQ